MYCRLANSMAMHAITSSPNFLGEVRKPKCAVAA